MLSIRMPRFPLVAYINATILLGSKAAMSSIYYYRAVVVLSYTMLVFRCVSEFDAHGVTLIGHFLPKTEYMYM